MCREVGKEMSRKKEGTEDKIEKGKIEKKTNVKKQANGKNRIS